MREEATIKHAKWGKYTVIVAEMPGGKWHANIMRPSQKSQYDIESSLKSGNGSNELNNVLKSFGAPNNLTWLPGNGE